MFWNLAKEIIGFIIVLPFALAAAGVGLFALYALLLVVITPFI